MIEGTGEAETTVLASPGDSARPDEVSPVVPPLQAATNTSATTVTHGPRRVLVRVLMTGTSTWTGHAVP